MGGQTGRPRRNHILMYKSYVYIYIYILPPDKDPHQWRPGANYSVIRFFSYRAATLGI